MGRERSVIELGINAGKFSVFTVILYNSDEADIVFSIRVTFAVFRDKNIN